MALHKDSRHKTAFKCKFGHFQFCTVPMGLISSASFFQRWIESKLERHGILYRQVHVGSETIGEKQLDPEGNTYTGFATVYLDDVVIFSRSAEDHKRHLVKLLEVLSLEGLHLQKHKCNMFCEMIQTGYSIYTTLVILGTYTADLSRIA
eukprot:SAG11_NODE_2619_length_3169_cov_5.194788_3_plen_149_part_00